MKEHYEIEKFARSNVKSRKTFGCAILRTDSVSSQYCGLVAYTLNLFFTCNEAPRPPVH